MEKRVRIRIPYILRIRIRGSVIQYYGSGSRREIRNTARNAPKLSDACDSLSLLPSCARNGRACRWEYHSWSVRWILRRWRRCRCAARMCDRNAANPQESRAGLYFLHAGVISIVSNTERTGQKIMRQKNTEQHTQKCQKAFSNYLQCCDIV